MRADFRLVLSVAGILVWSGQSYSQGTTPPGATTSLGVSVPLPQAYESTILALNALASTAATVLKANRANARALVIRTALAKKLLASAPSATSIVLDRDNQDPTLGEIALLCVPRQDYINNSVSLNYLNTLVQDINAVSATPPAPTDIAGALKLLLATSNYAVTDKVNVDAANITNLASATLASCKTDLSSYDQDYYGTAIRVSAPIVGHAAAPRRRHRYLRVSRTGWHLNRFVPFSFAAGSNRCESTGRSGTSPNRDRDRSRRSHDANKNLCDRQATGGYTQRIRGGV